MMGLSPRARERLAQEIEWAGGREVCFVGEVDESGTVTAVRVVARGRVDAVLALPGVAQRGEMVIHNHPSGVLDPSAADLAVAAKLYEAGVGFAIVNNDVSAAYVVVELPEPSSRRKIDPVETARLLAPGGRVARALGQFEDRPSQRDMASYVADVYNDGGVALLEAGTGVGKSFAYLVPAIVWAAENKERTVVSTNTINLQEQLVGKDLPLLARAFGGERPPTFALLKGWRNYVCLARLELASSGQGSLLEPERAAELESLIAWARRTSDGSLSDLEVEPSEEVWDEISAEPDLCPRLECPHFDRCFLFAARRRAAEADVVVVNHHLLASDLAVRKVQNNWHDAAVLPPYRRLVIDEAHHFEDTAAHHMGTEVTTRGLMRLLNRLERNNKGLIPALMQELGEAGDSLSRASVELLAKGLLPEVGEAKRHAEQLFTLLAVRLGGESMLRLDDRFARDPIWERGLGAALDNVVGVLGRLRDGVETVADRMQLAEGSDRKGQRLQELRGVVRRLQSAVDALLVTLRPAPGVASVRWVDRRGNRPVGSVPFPVGLASVPLDLADLLRETLFDRVETVVLTSATLAAGGDFGFLKERLGLTDPYPRVRYEEILPSPFDYGAQCLFCVPTDIPDPRSDESGHDKAVARAVIELAHAADGGMFVLFTSHAALKRVAEAVRGTLETRWPVLVQGEGQRDHLLRRFRESGSAVLFGTDSFWEGVDVPGPALRVLLIAKLPFKVPNDPLTEARLERLAEQGLDGFRHYLLPQAALKLKQGFGRLIRSHTDFGVVVLMDPRIVQRSYGPVLLSSLPPARRIIGPWGEVYSAAEDFFARMVRTV
ncbi:MAG: ATP-dependent DNA helicase DinG [Gemmatimonadales bacterium]|nr:MAG: ATP-dependent DNA helicase DinG [Gemmatimonadales bacterium]